jgi:hypothetical protein
MSNELLTLNPHHLRQIDSNSLLRLYDRAQEIRAGSPLQLERARADRIVHRIAQELRKRNVAFGAEPE